MARKPKNKRRSRARQAQQPEIKTRALWTAVIFAAIGAMLSLYATNLTFKIATEGSHGVGVVVRLTSGSTVTWHIRRVMHAWPESR